MAYLDALSLKVEPVQRYPIGRRCVYLPNDFKAFRADKSDTNSFFGWVRSWIRADKTVFCWDDPGPAVYSTLCSLRSTSRALKGRFGPKLAL
jgi:hypothetical protein